MKINYSFFLTILFFSASICTLQSCVNEANANPTKDKTKIEKWTSVEDAVLRANTDQKKILVDVYTDWCKWCKVMDDKTFSDPEVSQFLAKNFHVAKFNAEQKESLQFNGKNYSFIQNGKRGQHEFAIDILDGRLAFPSLVVFDSNLNKIEVIRGFKNPTELMKALK